MNAGSITYFLRLSIVVAVILSNSAAFSYDVIDVEHGGVVEAVDMRQHRAGTRDTLPELEGRTEIRRL